MNVATGERSNNKKNGIYYEPRCEYFAAYDKRRHNEPNVRNPVTTNKLPIGTVMMQAVDNTLRPPPSSVHGTVSFATAIGRSRARFIALTKECPAADLVASACSSVFLSIANQS